MITLLMIALIPCVMVQRSSGDTYCAAILVGIILVHDVLSINVSDSVYYLSAAISDLAVIILISKIKAVSDLIVRVQMLSVASIVANFIGWIAWCSYLPPDLYNAAFVAIYLCAIIILLDRSIISDVGHSSLYRVWHGVCCGAGSRGFNYIDDEGA